MESSGAGKIQFLSLILFLLIMTAGHVYGEVPSGYSEYFIPGDEENMNFIFDEISPYDVQGDGVTPDYLDIMHCIISVTSWSENTTIYYDHWEDGYGFDPDDPSTADEVYSFATAGASRIFESSRIPAAPRDPAVEEYDGKDRIYVAGGAVTVTRASWNDTNPADGDIGSTIHSTLLAVAWEIYPVRPQLIKYILPFGEDLAASGLDDFDRVFALVQATRDNTVVRVDFDKDGSFDILDQNRDGDTTDPEDDDTVELDAGEVFLLDRASINQATLDSGTVILGSETLQVHYVIGDQGSNYEIRGLTAFPRGLWDDEYYAPVDGPANSGAPVDLYLYNPHDTTLAILYETTTGGGTFTIAPETTRSFRDATGNYVPQDSAVYLKGSDVFWGVSTIDTEDTGYDWGYSLVPAVLLENEHYTGWAPGAYPAAAGTNADDSGLYLTPARDNTTIFVDYASDGFDTADGDVSYTLDRLETRYIYDSADGKMDEANIYATGPYSIAYGQNPDTASDGAPAIDVGYTTIPGVDFIDLVLTVDKSVTPGVISTVSGSAATFILTVNSHGYPVDSVSVVDTLPQNWDYDSTQLPTITLADRTQVSSHPAESINADGDKVLTWDSTILGDMAANHEIIIEFNARTTASFNSDDLSRNDVKAVGTRTVQGVTQTFTTTDFVFVSYSEGSMSVEKSSDAGPVSYPGDTITYTVTIENTGVTGLNNISVYDPLPTGLSFDSGSVTYPVPAGTFTFADSFASQSYNNSDGTADWTTSWTENNDDGLAGSGKMFIDPGNTCLRFAGNGDSDTFYIERTADLTGKTNRSLSFNYSEDGRLEDADRMTVTVNGQTVMTTSNDFGSGTYNDNISLESIIASTANPVVTVRFTAVGYAGRGEFWNLDDIVFQYDQTAGTASASLNNPPNLISASDGYNLAAGESLTIEFSATIDDPLATGIDEITNTVYVTADEIITPLSSAVTDIVNHPSSETGEVGDLVWFDVDRDGVKDVGENGFVNVEVTLKDEFGSPLAVTTTDGNGRYRFTGVEPGSDYFVEVTDGLPSGLTQSAPAGHTDDRTDPFDLTAGQVRLDADFGYKPDDGTGTIGNYVWHDADGDKFQDSGEPGLTGVTVELWQDNNSNGIFEFSTDTRVTTTTTAPDGSYLFTGVTAAGTEDYLVYVDGMQAILSGAGYSHTTSPVTVITDFGAGDVDLTNDFGFYDVNPQDSHSIKDRVWYDADENEEDDGESGIVNVTVDLLDASLNVIATTFTDAGGIFEFTGVPGNGADYTIRITDNNGKLTDYYGTTAESVDRELAVDNLNADIDFTLEGISEPNFGYSVSGAIGDTVFNDAGGIVGSQDSGELGISGVTVNLYLDDGDGLRNGADTLTATLTTDADGNYLFSGLANGTYFVDINPAQSVLSSYDTRTTADDDSAAGDQREIVINNNSYLNVDYGYKASVQGSITGTVWEDNNADGNIDAGEIGLSGVTIELRDSGGSTLAATITNTGGIYSFNGLPIISPAKTYTVVITDLNGVLNGYNTTYEVSPPLDGLEDVTPDNGNEDINNINFGYKNPISTRAVIGEFGAFNEGGKVVVRWQTLSEHGTVGFNLYRLNIKTGKYRSVNPKLLPGLIHAPAGGWYSYEDKGAKTGAYYTYRLEEVEAGGNRITYGPWRVFTGSLLADEDSAIRLDAHASVAGLRMAERPVSNEKIARLEAKMEARLQAYVKKMSRKGSQAKISVTEDGLYFIDADDIARVFDLSGKYVAKMIRADKLRLRCMGRKVAVLPADDFSGLYFYGQRLETRYTDENVYWLDIDKALKMKKVKRSPKVQADDLQYFHQWVWEEESNYPLTTLFTDPQSDFWMWDYIFPGGGHDRLSITVSAPGIADVETAVLTVALKGASDACAGNDHHAVIRVNGVQVGDVGWDGFDPQLVSFPVDTKILNDGENHIEISGIREAGVSYDIFYLNYLNMVYPRTYSASGNRLVVENNGYETIMMRGFTDSRIQVFDITDPRKPKVVSGTVIEPSDTVAGEYLVSFRADAPVSRYIALTPDSVEHATLLADQPSCLSKQFNMGNYLIITSGELMEAAGVLADYRASQGYLSMVVDVEDIYDEFAYGVKDAEAIRSFLGRAISKWRIPPEYVVLAGDGSFDYRDYKGYGDSIIPALLTGTPDGLFVTDNPYADVAGDDWIPEVSLGRIPAINPDELLNYIDKIIGYESADGNWIKQAILAADAPDAGGNFPVSSEQVAAFFPDDFLIDRLYLDEMTVKDARANMISGINGGRAYINFIGHGGPTSIGNTRLLSVDHLPHLMNRPLFPVFTAMTCMAGNFGYPGLDGFNEAMVIKADGGAVAMWAPSGFAFNHHSLALCKGFYAAVFNDGAKVLGDAIRSAQIEYAKQTEKSFYHLDLYNLIGDPALVLK